VDSNIFIQHDMLTCPRFLLAQLHLRSLIPKRSPKAIRNALERLPPGSGAYDAAYEEVMERINSHGFDYSELAKEVISWIVCSRRTLTTMEIQHAIAIEPGESDIDQDNFTPVEHLVCVCAGLVVVDECSSTIRLVHYTAQEYFQRT
jgi:GPI inositol-deacylase, winged helix domain